MDAKDPKIVAVSLEAYFHDLLRTVAARQHVKLTELGFIYLLNLLTEYSAPERIMERSEEGKIESPVLAELFQRAAEARLNAEKVALLRRLGDVSLFIAGFFPDSLSRSLVDVAYYMAMGENAYRIVSDLLTRARSESDAEELFRDLAAKFSTLVDLLGEISEETRLTDNLSLLRLYERCLATGSERLQKKLMERGILFTKQGLPDSVH